MLVRFISSETGELMMFAEAARPLLQILGKATTARGTFTRAEMGPAAQVLRDAVKRVDAPPPEDEELDEAGNKKPPVVAMSQRAWPLIDMLERSGQGGAKANIVWEAPADF